MVISTLLLAGILVTLFSDSGSLVRGRYIIYIHFDEAPGVSDGTPVRKSGILIGRVTAVEFAQPEGVDVTVEIRNDVQIRRNEVPQVSGSLLGVDVVIQFVKRPRPPTVVAPPAAAPEGTNDQSSVSPIETRTGDGGPPAPDQGAAAKTPAPKQDEFIRPGDLITGTVSPSPIQVFTDLEDNLAGAIDSLSNAGSEVGKVASSINRLMEGNEDQFNNIIKNTETTLASLQKALANIDDVIGDPEVRESLRQTIDGFPEVLTDMRSAMNTVRTTVESVDRNMRNLEGFTGPLGERGEQIVMRVDRTVLHLDGLLGEMSDFGKKLNSGEGSLGRIMRDPDLYQNLNRAAQNIAQLTCELRPIVADARVFSDKIARHPELLGIRGALQRSPGTK